MAEFALHDKEAQAFLKKLIKKKEAISKGQQEYVSLLSAIVYSDIIDHFEHERGSEGPWKEWSKAYRAHMQAIGKEGNRILQDTGRLRQSFMPTNWKLTTEGILWFNPAKTRSGFPYAAAHDEGGKKLPKRDFMWLSDQARERISDQTLEFLEDV